MGIWNQVWKALGDGMAQLSLGWQVAAVLGAGLLALTLLEGLHLLFFPRRVLSRLVRRYPDAIFIPAESAPEVVRPKPQPVLKPQLGQASGVPRRWQRHERQRPTRFVSRIRRPMN